MVETILVHLDGHFLAELEVSTDADKDKVLKEASKLLPKDCVCDKHNVVLHKFVTFFRKL
jgi:hypothetical protein